MFWIVLDVTLVRNCVLKLEVFEDTVGIVDICKLIVGYYNENSMDMKGKSGLNLTCQNLITDNFDLYSPKWKYKYRCLE